MVSFCSQFYLSSNDVQHRRHEQNETTMLINFQHVKRLFEITDYVRCAHIIFYSSDVLAVTSLIFEQQQKVNKKK